MNINNTPYGIKLAISSILVLMAIAFYQLGTPLLSFLLILIILIMFTSQSGIEFSKDKKKYRSYITYAGIIKGKWKNLENYTGIVIISGKGSKQIWGFYQTSSINKKEAINKVYLVDKTHHNKMLVANETDSSNAEKFAKSISNEINVPIVKYAPQASQKTISRRLKR